MEINPNHTIHTPYYSNLNLTNPNPYTILHYNPTTYFNFLTKSPNPSESPKNNVSKQNLWFGLRNIITREQDDRERGIMEKVEENINEEDWI